MRRVEIFTLTMQASQATSSLLNQMSIPQYIVKLLPGNDAFVFFLLSVQCIVLFVIYNMHWKIIILIQLWDAISVPLYYLLWEVSIWGVFCKTILCLQWFNESKMQNSSMDISRSSLQCYLTGFRTQALCPALTQGLFAGSTHFIIIYLKVVQMQSSFLSVMMSKKSTLAFFF